MEIYIIKNIWFTVHDNEQKAGNNSSEVVKWGDIILVCSHITMIGQSTETSRCSPPSFIAQKNSTGNFLAFF